MLSITPVAAVASYHAHIYFKDASERAQAELLRAEIGERFLVRLGRWHDRLVGPHTRPMYQVLFATELFASVVPWLMLNRRDLAVLIHPNSGRPRRDHLVHALWLGEILPILHIDLLPETSSGEPEEPLAPNTAPTLSP